jgi:outer membrane receptor protein involved in Fe transport
VLVTERFISSLVVYNPSELAADPTGVPYAPGTEPPLKVPDIYYTDIAAGYTFPTKTRIQFTLMNTFNREPPILYQNNVSNVNTDVNTYDVLGRRWSLQFTQKF